MILNRDKRTHFPQRLSVGQRATEKVRQEVFERGVRVLLAGRQARAVNVARNINRGVCANSST